MDNLDPPVPGPPLEDIDPVFHVYETRVENERLLYYGELEVPEEAAIEEVWPVFQDRGYAVDIRSREPETVLVATPVRTRQRGRPLLSGLLLLATIIATLWAGTTWYFVRAPLADPVETVLRVWPFTAAVMGVLGVHELAHFVAFRRHGVDVSIPYFIPFPSLIGTMGAVISIRGRIPDRRALFDIGASGPLAGFVAAIVVSAVGLLLPPVAVPEWALVGADSARPTFGYPLVIQGLSIALGEPLTYDAPTRAVNPVLFGGWVGLFVTFLNLLPVGQLDGGHILRSVIGDRGQFATLAVPVFLFGLGAILFFRFGAVNSAAIWSVWGLLSIGLAVGGTADPVLDESLAGGRLLAALLTLLVALLCFTPIPIQVAA